MLPTRDFLRGLARIVVVVGALALALGLASDARAAPGDLDASFGSGGKLVTPFGPAGSGLALQSDRKIVVVGASGSGGFGVVRYLADGSLDPSFGSGGEVSTVFGIFDAAFAVAIQQDGKIVAVGKTAPGGFCCQFALARYNDDGGLDGSFGSGGQVTTAFGGDAEAAAVAIQPDGKIVVVGWKYDPFAPGFVIARYNSDGSLDPSFGTDGAVLMNFGGVADRGTAVALQPDGAIIAAGVGGPSNDFALARLDADGSLDPSFGSGGKVTTDFGGFDGANGVVFQSDGKIVAAGIGSERFALARYSPDGTLDASFGSGGKVTTTFTGQNIEQANALAIDSDGEIVAAGRAFSDFGGNFALAGYRANGSLDTGFGTGGKVLTSFGDGSQDDALAVAIQADGKIVTAGGGGPCIPTCQFELARYAGVSVVDTTPPSITVPGTITLPATTREGAVVTYEVTATDPDDQVASLSCAPASGSTFPIGTTTVVCTATDTNGNSASASFSVHVEGAAEQLADLASAVTGVGPGTSLRDKVTAAAAALLAGDPAKASAILSTFIQEVQAQTGKKIEPTTARALINDAMRIQAVLRP